MANESQNVLVGVASLAIRQPNDALAEWVSDIKYAGSHSVKLSKGGSGNAGSTHLQLTPRGVSAAVTMATFEAAIKDATHAYSFYHKSQNGVTGNYAQFEFRFEDPDSDGWIEVTFVTLQNHEADGEWKIEALADGDKAGYGGVSDIGHSFSNWALTAIDGLGEEAAGADYANCTISDWVLSRIRVELWEPEPARYCHIDSVVIHGVTYEIEPGAATAPGLSLSSPYVDVGYTEDGVNFNYTVDIAEIKVEEETFPIDGKITSETLEIVCNMAESSLFNIDKAIAGSVLSGNILTIGDGILKKMSIKLTGITPAGTERTYEFPKVIATGAVGMSFRRAEKTIVPLTFRALKPASGPVGTFVDNA